MLDLDDLDLMWWAPRGEILARRDVCLIGVTKGSAPGTASSHSPGREFGAFANTGVGGTSMDCFLK